MPPTPAPALANADSDDWGDFVSADRGAPALAHHAARQPHFDEPDLLPHLAAPRAKPSPPLSATASRSTASHSTAASSPHTASEPRSAVSPLATPPQPALQRLQTPDTTASHPLSSTAHQSPPPLRIASPASPSNSPSHSPCASSAPSATTSTSPPAPLPPALSPPPTLASVVAAASASASASPSPKAASPTAPLQGFDTLDAVQRYALGALAVVLLQAPETDLNGAAFARTQSSTILDALHLTLGQHAALLALDPTDSTRHTVVADCVRLVGSFDARWRALQAMLALCVASGVYDARSRSFLALVAHHFSISWRAVAAVELAIGVELCAHAESAAAAAPSADTSPDAARGNGSPSDATSAATTAMNSASSSSSASTVSANGASADAKESAEGAAGGSSKPANTPRALGEALTARRKKKNNARKAMKIGGITLVGGVLFGLTGGLIAPALLSALAGVGVASAAGLAATGTFASSAVVGGLFGVAGGGFSLRKARHRHNSRLSEFDFERPDDPRVIAERERRAERRRRKLERLVAKRLEEQALANERLAIESGETPETAENSGLPDPETELPRPTSISDVDDDGLDGDEDDDDDDDDDDRAKGKSRFGRRRKKREKVKVGVRGLESAASVPSLHVCICVPAWLTARGYGASLDQFEAALKQELPCSQHIALRWESRRLYEMGLAFAKFWASKATVTTVQQAYPHAIAAASTVAGAVAFAFALPLTVMSCMDYIDNPWSVLVTRSNAAGEELADVLVERSYGNRPVTLFGYSIGARVIFKCLESLVSRGARGIVDNVFLMGAAVTADPERWQRIRPVVAGRIVNAYGSYDWALAFFHRGCGHGVYVSGLRRVDVDFVENLNMAFLGIEGHRELKDCVPRVMRAMGVGLGYITMPPARLLQRRKRTSSQGDAEADRASAVDEPVPGEGAEHGENGAGSNSSLNAMRFDSFWDSSGQPDPADDRGSSSGELKIAPAGAALSESESGKTSEVESVGDNGSESGAKERTWSKRNKSKSWLSWTSWGGSSSRSKSRSSVGKDAKSKGGDSAATSGAEAESVRMEELSDARDNSPARVSGAGAAAPSAGSVSVPGEAAPSAPMATNDSMLASQYGMLDSDFENGEDDSAKGSFDWEKQRQIWDEQERQMQERGYADSALEIEMRDKVVLNVSVEVAGRRLDRFIDQDMTLPVARKEQVYTNCLETQRGMTIRVYEHEKQSKMAPNNGGTASDADAATYPKLLGELELELRDPGVKGLLRVAVGMHVDEGGDVHVSAEERFTSGESAEPVTLTVPRSDLCTMAERTRLEAAERKRVEAQIQRELRNRNALPALPAPAAAASSSAAGSAPAAKGSASGAEKSVGKESDKPPGDDATR